MALVSHRRAGDAGVSMRLRWVAIGAVWLQLGCAGLAGTFEPRDAGGLPAQTEDAGLEPDAGAPEDAGQPDAGPTPDAGPVPDAGAPDAGRLTHPAFLIGGQDMRHLVSFDGRTWQGDSWVAPNGEDNAFSGAATGLLTGGHPASWINRAIAFYRHFAGIPTDVEPPAVR